MQRFAISLTPLALLVLAGCQGAPSTTEPSPLDLSAPPSRSFHIRYVARLEGLPPGEKLRLWIPVPRNDPHQAIRNLEVDASWDHEERSDPVHRNRMLYFEGMTAADEMEVTVEYDVDRWPYLSDLEELETDGTDAPDAVAPFLEPSSLCVVNDRLATEAATLSMKRSGSLSKARAFYEHVRGVMSYDKSGTGWGRGDTLYACDARRGNCTDYHSYFISLCLAEKIPARFQIGLYGSYEPLPGVEQKTGSYHCWAEFRVPGKAWVPVDISEGDKDPARASFLFGNHTDNRVTLSTGRDIVLSPPQTGPPLNYFVNPYAEVAGRPFDGAEKQAYWTDERVDWR
ncbi:MAG: transglutaminase-like domain-containing protein [Planctomycetota bacterium]